MLEVEFHRALHRPGTIIDAGAHEGRITRPLAQLPSSQVIAFEPLPPAFARLTDAIAQDWGGAVPSHVTLRQEALAAEAGTATLEVPRVGGVAQEEWASLVKDYAALQQADPRIEAIDTWTVKLLKLDDLELPDVTAMKIDTEGSELEVLQGARETLRRSQPSLSVEIEERHRPGSTRDVPLFLRDLGYEGWFELFGHWRRMEELDLATMQQANPSPAAFSASHPYVFVFYFIPPERRAALGSLAALP
jgi:FkbM family methyltransferase